MHGNYGWPFCFGDQEADIYGPYTPPGTTTEQYCANPLAPALTYTAHSSPIGFLFYTADQFPDEYNGDAFVAMRGSWNRDPASGYEVVRIDFEDGRPVSAGPFISGWLLPEGTAQFGRVAGLVIASDGSMLISDDTNGVIYRVGYTGS
jgi:glucose/arabinose dehydrogenase